MTKPALKAGLQVRVWRYLLDSHGHHNVFKSCVVRNRKKRGTVGVSQLNLHHVLAHIGKCVNQISDIETDFDGITAIVDVELVNSFFLFGIVAGNSQSTRLNVETHTLEFFTGQDCCALQTCQQRRTAQRNDVFMVLRTGLLGAAKGLEGPFESGFFCDGGS